LSAGVGLGYRWASMRMLTIAQAVRTTTINKHIAAGLVIRARWQVFGLPRIDYHAGGLLWVLLWLKGKVAMAIPQWRTSDKKHPNLPQYFFSFSCLRMYS